MTGISYLVPLAKRALSKMRSQKLFPEFPGSPTGQMKFVVLTWNHTGSDFLSDILHAHPEITMHKELFSNLDLGTYHPHSFHGESGTEIRWNVVTRDLDPKRFLEQIWTARLSNGDKIREQSKAVGFVSFPEHWNHSGNEKDWLESIMKDGSVKKIILSRADELALYVSMLQEEENGNGNIRSCPTNLSVHVYPSKLQVFIDDYRQTLNEQYLSHTQETEVFRLTYEQLIDENSFLRDTFPSLCKFLGVSGRLKLKIPPEYVRKISANCDISTVISNYGELQFCFQNTDVLIRQPQYKSTSRDDGKMETGLHTTFSRSWSILLPICSREILNNEKLKHSFETAELKGRSAELQRSNWYPRGNQDTEANCWKLLRRFAKSLFETTTAESRGSSECIIGIDIDDSIYGTPEARKTIRSLIPVQVRFVDIEPALYGQVCRIWNLLATIARNDFIVLLGDDVKLIDNGWQERVVERFHEIASQNCLPFGAACVAMNDVTFKGFPTFPVIHRWHLDHFRSLLPGQFVNQGGDPYLFALYSRHNAASFVGNSRLENTIGGKSIARYTKHCINWSGVLLEKNITLLQNHLGGRHQTGICLDVVVPSYRINNITRLKKIISLRASIPITTIFWIIVDNPDEEHVQEVFQLAEDMNEKIDGWNYYTRFVTYGENKGASHARNTGYNSSTADWVLFLDDDVVPDSELLDAYAGAIKRYPHAKVLVGLTEMPPAFNRWTHALSTANVMYFFGVAKLFENPPWGVTANILVRGSRHNQTVQFKNIYPKSGGGEDVDFVFQMKAHYKDAKSVVSVPNAKVLHPWWNEGKSCYRQVCGWAWGDFLCAGQWPRNKFWACPNWIEFSFFVVLASIAKGYPAATAAMIIFFVALTDSIVKTTKMYERKPSQGRMSAVLNSTIAGTIISAQEMTRAIAMCVNGYMFGLRMDWFDGRRDTQVQDIQFESLILFIVYTSIYKYIV